MREKEHFRIICIRKNKKRYEWIFDYRNGIKKVRWACRMLLRSGTVEKLFVRLSNGDKWVWYENKWLLAYKNDDDDDEI